MGTTHGYFLASIKVQLWCSAFHLIKAHDPIQVCAVSIAEQAALWDQPAELLPCCPLLLGQAAKHFFTPTLTAAALLHTEHGVSFGKAAVLNAYSCTKHSSSKQSVFTWTALCFLFARPVILSLFFSVEVFFCQSASSRRQQQRPV